jgi:hypothetical protein
LGEEIKSQLLIFLSRKMEKDITNDCYFPKGILNTPVTLRMTTAF